MITYTHFPVVILSLLLCYHVLLFFLLIFKVGVPLISLLSPADFYPIVSFQIKSLFLWLRLPFIFSTNPNVYIEAESFINQVFLKSYHIFLLGYPTGTSNSKYLQFESINLFRLNSFFVFPFLGNRTHSYSFIISNSLLACSNSKTSTFSVFIASSLYPLQINS